MWQTGRNALKVMFFGHLFGYVDKYAMATTRHSIISVVIFGKCAPVYHVYSKVCTAAVVSFIRPGVFRVDTTDTHCSRWSMAWRLEYPAVVAAAKAQQQQQQPKEY